MLNFRSNNRFVHYNGVHPFYADAVRYLSNRNINVFGHHIPILLHIFCIQIFQNYVNTKLK